MERRRVRDGGEEHSKGGQVLRLCPPAKGFPEGKGVRGGEGGGRGDGDGLQQGDPQEPWALRGDA